MKLRFASPLLLLLLCVGCANSGPVRRAYNAELTAKSFADGVIAARQLGAINDADYSLVWPLTKTALQKSDEALTQATAGNALTLPFYLSAAESALDDVYKWSLDHPGKVKIPAPLAP